MNRPVRAYIEAKLADESKITQMRDDLYSRIPSNTDYCRKDPHLTIIPPFTIDAQHIHKVDERLAESPLLGGSVPINGVGLWPSVENPRVVLLDADIDLSGERQRVLQHLNDLGAVEIEEPVNPHITLFKTDCGYSLSDAQRQEVRQIVAENRETWETEIQYIDCTVVAELSEPPTPGE